MDTRLAPSDATDDSPTLIDMEGPLVFSGLHADEQALPEQLRPADELLRRLAAIPCHEPPQDLAERTLSRCRR